MCSEPIEHEINSSIQVNSTSSCTVTDRAGSVCPISIYDFSDEDTSRSCTEIDSSNDTNYPKSTLVDFAPSAYPCTVDGALSTIRFVDPEKIISQFHSFLKTKGGGGRRNTPTKGDVSNLRCLIRELRFENFWDPNKLNQ